MSLPPVDEDASRNDGLAAAKEPSGAKATTARYRNSAQVVMLEGIDALRSANSSVRASTNSRKSRGYIRMPSDAAASAKGAVKRVAKIVTASKFTTRAAELSNDKEWGSQKELLNAGMLIEDELMRNPMFCPCSHAFLSWLSTSVSGRQIPTGTSIVSAGSSVKSLFLVLAGKVDVIIEDERVAQLETGRFLGETLLLGFEETWRATLVASSRATVCEIPQDVFTACLERFPSEAKHFESIIEGPTDFMKIRGTMMNACEVFSGISQECMEAIDNATLQQVRFPGEHLLDFGALSGELHILTNGRATVEIAGKRVRSETETVASGRPACFGELGLLGLCETNTSTVVCQTGCHVRVLHRCVLLRILEVHGADMPATPWGSARASSGSAELRNLTIFRDGSCCSQFLSFLEEHLESRLYLQGQYVMDESVPQDHSIYILCRGVLEESNQGSHMGILQAGATFGEIPALNITTRPVASVHAKESCVLHVLHLNVIVRALELFPEERPRLMGIWPLEDHRSSTTPRKSEHGFRGVFTRALMASPLFANTAPEFLEELSKVAVDRLFVPGNLIMEQGSKSNSMFIMISGTAAVYVFEDSDATIDQAQIAAEAQMATKGNGRKKEPPPTEGQQPKLPSVSRIGTLDAGSISGELALLGVAQARSATIEATTICSMWEIPQEKALPILQHFTDARRHFHGLIISHLERTVPPRMLSCPLLKGFERSFRMLLGMYCDRLAFFPGQVIAKEGQAGDRLFIINSGRATIEKKGMSVKILNAGSHFGSTVMLGVHKGYCGTLVATQTCHVLAVSRTSYQQALEKYPSAQVAQELKRNEKAAVESMREGLDRIASRKLIWKRYQGYVAPTSSGGNEHLQNLFHGWHEQALHNKSARANRLQQRQHYEKTTQEWLQKRERLRHQGEPVQTDAKPPSVELGRPTGDASGRRVLKLLEDWPTPRPSPFYNLNLWGMLSDTLEYPGVPLLPFIPGAEPAQDISSLRSALKVGLGANPPAASSRGDGSSNGGSENGDEVYDGSLGDPYQEYHNDQKPDSPRTKSLARPTLKLGMALGSLFTQQDLNEMGLKPGSAGRNQPRPTKRASVATPPTARVPAVLPDPRSAMPTPRQMKVIAE